MSITVEVISISYRHHPSLFLVGGGCFSFFLGGLFLQLAPGVGLLNHSLLSLTSCFRDCFSPSLVAVTVVILCWACTRFVLLVDNPPVYGASRTVPWHYRWFFFHGKAIMLVKRFLLRKLDLFICRRWGYLSTDGTTFFSVFCATLYSRWKDRWNLFYFCPLSLSVNQFYLL